MIAKTRRILLAAALLAPTAWALPCPAAEPAVDPKARALFDEVARAYKALPAYADQGEFSFQEKAKDRIRKHAVKSPVTFARPNRIDLADPDGEVRVVSDGATLTTRIKEKYHQAPAPKALTPRAIQLNPVAGALTDNLPGLPAKVVLTLLTADDPARDLLDRGTGLRLEADRKDGGKAARVLLMDRKTGPDLRLVIDPDTKLVRRVEFVIDAKDLPVEPVLVPDSVAWDAGTIKTDEPARGAFAFKATEGATKVRRLVDLMRRPSPIPLPVEEWLGKSAPDFTLTVLDGPGKTKQVRKANLAGKVVVIDFWATWCPPCMKELPEVRDLVASYNKKGARDVVIIALSQDEGDGPTGSRNLVEKTLADEGVDLTGGQVGMVALDPAGDVGQAFKATSLPTLMVLDAKGVVRSIHIGFDPEIQDVLTKEIDDLRAGKPPDPHAGE